MDMKGKTAFITGSTDGVGRYVATELAKAGAKVLPHIGLPLPLSIPQAIVHLKALFSPGL